MISSVISLKNNTILVHSEEVNEVGTKFTPGFYKAMTTDSGIHITREKLNEIHTPFKTQETESVLSTVRAFFQEGVREKVNALGFIHKLGVLLYGIAGTSKTSVLNYIANELVEEKEAVVFFCHDGNSFSTAISLAKRIRDIQDNPIVFIADEFERFAQSEEAKMKTFLDGVDSIENSLFLSATNYIEKVPDTIKERPSRIRLVLEFKGIEDKEVMKDILRSISDKISPSLFNEQEIQTAFEDINHVTIDEIKAMCLAKITDTFVRAPKRSSIGFRREEPEDGLGIYWTIKQEPESEYIEKTIEKHLKK